MKPDRAVHYASLFSELWSACKKIVQKDLRLLSDAKVENPLEVIRLRTKQQTEVIVSQIEEYTLVCIQYCGPPKTEEKAVVVGEGGAPAEKKEEEKKK